MGGAHRNILRVVAAGAALLPFAASGQPFYFLEGEIRPPAMVTPTAFFRIPATRTATNGPAGQLTVGFVHWNLREFPGCSIPYSITQAATADASTTQADARIAITNGFQHWEDVAPALIGFSRQTNLGEPAGGRVRAGMDGQNAMLWDGGDATNLMAFGAAPSGTLAITFVFYNNSVVIQESDILYNDRDYQWNNTGDDFRAANRQVVTANTAPFALANNDTLIVKVNGGAAVTITFTNAQFANIAAATRQEVRDAIIAGLGAGMATADSFPNNTVSISSTRTVYDGNTSIEVVGGTANAAGKLNFPLGVFRPRSADVETIATHESGHFCGVHHTSQASPAENGVVGGAVMYFQAPTTGTKRALAAPDVQALNFLYTPDLGDAPDPCVAGGPFNFWETLVHSPAPGRVFTFKVNPDDPATWVRYQLNAVGQGPDHLFGFSGPNIAAGGGLPAQNYSLDRYEWLGVDMDDSNQECEARVPNMDMFDDGVTITPMPLVRGKTATVTITTTHTGGPDNRYSAANARARLYNNGYIDWYKECTFPTKREVWADFVPGMTVARSSNWIGASHTGGIGTPGTTVQRFVVFVPRRAAASTFARFRLDLGENEGRVVNWEGDLGPAVGAAQFGEVEDHPIMTVPMIPPTPDLDQLHLYGPYPNIVVVSAPGAPGPSVPLVISTQSNFVGVPSQLLTVSVVSGSATLGGFGSNADGTEATQVTDNGGLATVQITGGVNPGPGLLRVSVADSDLVAFYPFTVAPAVVAGDADGDCTVGFADLTLVLANYGVTGYGLPGDLNFDGKVDFQDLSLLLAHFGQRCN